MNFKFAPSPNLRLGQLRVRVMRKIRDTDPFPCKSSGLIKKRCQCAGAVIAKKKEPKLEEHNRGEKNTTCGARGNLAALVRLVKSKYAEPRLACDTLNSHSAEQPPKNEVIALWLNTHVVKCKYCVSQKRNEANNKNQWFNVLLTFIFKFTARS